MTRQVLRRMWVPGLVSMVSLGVTSAALANTVQFEAESVRRQDVFRGTITSPLMINDDGAASGGSYVMVAPGNNSPSTAPASTTEGVVKYVFSVADTGTYRIWARVSAPTTSDDSFWIRVGNSAAWIKWNNIPLGTPFHWVLVKAESASSPSTFNLIANVDNELQVAYREDGTKLDAFYITNDAAFNPAAAITGPPEPPIMQPEGRGGGSTKLSWSAVPGATSYNLETWDGGCDCSTDDSGNETCTIHPFTVKVPGITGHKYVDVGVPGGTYRVTAVGPTGSSVHPQPEPNACFYPFGDPSQQSAQGGDFRLFAQLPAGSVTAPMTVDSVNRTIGAPTGMDSKTAVPAHGRYRMDFELAGPALMRMWAGTIAPSTSQDSFWVRWDDGAWINWNNLTGCATLHDSGKSGDPIVRQLMSAGSHRIEWAYREGGARIEGHVVLAEDKFDQGNLTCSD